MTYHTITNIGLSCHHQGTIQQSLQPRVYFTCLCCRGKRTEPSMSTLCSLDEIVQAKQQIIARCDCHDVVIKDWENFGDLVLHPRTDQQVLYDMADFIRKHGTLGADLLAYYDNDVTLARNVIEQHYLGCFDSCHVAMQQLLRTQYDLDYFTVHDQYFMLLDQRGVHVFFHQYAPLATVIADKVTQVVHNVDDYRHEMMGNQYPTFDDDPDIVFKWPAYNNDICDAFYDQKAWDWQLDLEYMSGIVLEYDEEGKFVLLRENYVFHPEPLRDEYMYQSDYAIIANDLSLTHAIQLGRRENRRLFQACIQQRRQYRRMLYHNERQPCFGVH